MSTLIDPRLSARDFALRARSSSLLKSAGALARTLLSWPLRIHRNRQLLHQMGGMSDHELADIGLRRTDISDGSALPLGSEIGSFLGQRAAERRIRRR